MNGLKKVLVFRTLPDLLNSNLAVERSFSEAMAKTHPDVTLNRTAINTVAASISDFSPDLAIGVGGFAHDQVDYSAIWAAAQKASSVLVYWQLDDPYEIDYNWKIDGKCDWLFTNDRASSEYYSSGRVSHLPLAAARGHFLPIRSFAEREVDIFFCGVAYPNRQQIIYQLRHVLADYRTEIYGDGWDAAHQFCQNRRLSNTRIIDSYSRAKVVLNLGRDYNIANARFEVAPSTPGPRTFEAAAAGSVQAMFLDSLEVFDFFCKVNEILHFSSVEEFGDLVRRVLKDDDYAQRIAAASQDRARRDHQYVNRVHQLISKLRLVGLI